MIKNFNKAFSLVEMLVAAAIASAIFLAVFNFGASIFSFNSNAQANLSAQTDGRRVLKNIVKELRSSSPSSLGSYSLTLASSTGITFFVNLDNDIYKEQVRYFLQGRELKRGVIKPSGSPLSYNPANEQLSTVIGDLSNGATPIFDYFDSNYAGTSTPMAQPVQITKVRLIRVTLIIDRDTNRSPSPIMVTSQVFLRNLKDNL
jgi:prepilin-type N-terminal cleavage/methylation domain-containing protein